ncbi:MAG TPA: hypothetical protein VGC62_17995 [Pseudomonas sp.]
MRRRQELRWNFIIQGCKDLAEQLGFSHKTISDTYSRQPSIELTA